MSEHKIQWSFSALKTFEQCPRKYYHTKIAGDVKDSPGTAALYGLRFHEAAEHYGRDGKRLPSEFRHHQPLLDTLLGIEGDKYFELEMGIKKADNWYDPCEFNDEDRWFRCIADFVCVNGDVAHSVDYKTSKSARYADTRQLDVVAAALFLKFPDLDTVKSGLLFTECKDFIKKTHYREHLENYLKKFETPLYNLESCLETGVWNTKTSPLCGYCPVSQCEHHPDGG